MSGEVFEKLEQKEESVAPASTDFAYGELSAIGPDLNRLIELWQKAEKACHKGSLKDEKSIKFVEKLRAADTSEAARAYIYHLRAADIARKKMLSELSNLPSKTAPMGTLIKYLSGYPHYHISRIMNPLMLFYGFDWSPFTSQKPFPGRMDVLNRVLDYLNSDAASEINHNADHEWDSET
ncbi:MAG: hypothetical protein K0Q74_82 [Gammaproteobacteria bacterium]|jgi:hypothetical protein|nr:hypothetical protein [Gammaproteobacteria bacterium]